jgi:hypothetical protein
MVHSIRLHITGTGAAKRRMQFRKSVVINSSKMSKGRPALYVSVCACRHFFKTDLNVGRLTVSLPATASISAVEDKAQRVGTSDHWKKKNLTKPN